MNAEPETESLPELLKRLRDDAVLLVREEVALVRKETSENLKRVATKLGWIAGAGLLAISSVTPILIGLGFLLRDFFVNRGMGEGAAVCLGMFLVSITVALICVAVIRSKLQSLARDSIVPDRTLRSLSEDKLWIQQKLP